MDALAPSRLTQGYRMQHGYLRHKAEARKIERYREFLDNGNLFQPVAMEVQGSLGDCSDIFITRLCKSMCVSFARRSTRWQLLIAAELERSSNRQLGLCSRQGW